MSWSWSRGIVTMIALGIIPAAVAGQSSEAASAPPPAMVTPASLKAGRAVYRGAGNCVACHGARLEGGAIAPPLTAHKWRNGDGSYPMIVHVVSTGVPNTAMVAYPGGITPEQARLVAAYVWSVGQGKAKP